MTDGQWQTIVEFRKNFASQVERWMSYKKKLVSLQKMVAQEDGVPEYPFETAVVYNKALDFLTKDDEIKLIVIGDNPGKDEQLAKNNRYLVGQAGKIGEGYFNKNRELGVDFRKNVIILNKTPVHSAKTAELKKMAKEGGTEIAELLEESQRWMARQTAVLLGDMCRYSGDYKPELWLIGYSELKDKGIFAQYKRTLKETCLELGKDVWNQVYVYQHFSMNRFSIDLKENLQNLKAKDLKGQLKELGEMHRRDFFGE